MSFKEFSSFVHKIDKKYRDCKQYLNAVPNSSINSQHLYFRILFCMIINEMQSVIEKIGKNIIEQCNEHIKMHRKWSPEFIKNINKKFKHYRMSITNNIDVLQPEDQSFNEILEDVEQIINKLKYDWQSDWQDGMFPLWQAFLIRSCLHYRLGNIEKCSSDLKHSCDIWKNFPKQEQMKRCFLMENDEKEWLPLILALIIAVQTNHNGLSLTITKSNNFIVNLVHNDDNTVNQQQNQKSRINIESKTPFIKLFKLFCNEDDNSKWSFSHEDLFENIQRFIINNQIEQQKTPDSDNSSNAFYINESLIKLYKANNGDRQYVAAEHIVTDEVLVQERPILTALFSENIKKYCSNCFQELTNVTSWPCKSCDEVLYCSLECQTKNWDNFHRFECGITGLLIGSKDTFFSTIHVFRWYSMMQPDLVEQCETEHQQQVQPIDSLIKTYAKTMIKQQHIPYCQWSTCERQDICNAITNLKHHQGERDSLRESIHIAMAISLVYYFVYKKIYREQDLLGEDNFSRFAQLTEMFTKALLRMGTNGFCWAHYDDSKCHVDRIGSSICFLASFFNHSCLPNVKWSFKNNGIIQMKAIRPIKPGEPLTIGYGPRNENMDFHQRQKILREDYCFFCRCSACRMDAARSNWSMRCSDECVGPLLLNTHHEACLKCAKQPSNIQQAYNDMLSMKKAQEKLIKEFDDIEKSILDERNLRFIRKQGISISKVDKYFKFLINRITGQQYLQDDGQLNYIWFVEDNSLLNNLSFKNDIEKRLVKMERYFQTIRNKSYPGSFILLDQTVMLAKVYRFLRQDLLALRTLLPIIDAFLQEDVIINELVDIDQVTLIKNLDWICRFVQRFFEFDVKHNQNQNYNYKLCANFIDNNILNYGNESGGQTNNEHSTTILSNSKLWLLALCLNRTLESILDYDIQHRGHFFPRLFSVISKAQSQAISTLKNYPEFLQNNDNSENNNNKPPKFEHLERYYKKMFQDCQRRLKHLNKITKQ